MDVLLSGYNIEVDCKRGNVGVDFRVHSYRLCGGN